MINFESQHFQKLVFKEQQIDQFLMSAQHDLKIADEDIIVLGNKMRQERNVNLYDGGFFVVEKDGLEYLKFVKSTFKKAGI